MIVMAGQGEYRNPEGSFDLTRGTMTIAPPATAHGIRNVNSEPLIVLTIEGPAPFDSRVLERASDEKSH
jgi:mannose-6-phosphate isomerase-like protein (cupin superfamily)